MVYKRDRQRENGQHEIMTEPSVCWCALWLAVWEWQLVCVGWDAWAWLGEACENELMAEACIWYFHEKKRLWSKVCAQPLSETNQRPERRGEGAISTVYYKVSSDCLLPKIVHRKILHTVIFFYVNVELRQRGDRIYFTLSLCSQPLTFPNLMHTFFTLLTLSFCFHLLHFQSFFCISERIIKLYKCITGSQDR